MEEGVPTMGLTQRKRQILKRVVEDYINNAEPVGSKAIAEEMGGAISSATVRNELADLVEMGYLEQPHTSAGRVPSPKGYRLYVNEMMERHTLSEQETEQIDASLRGKLSALDSVVSQAGQIVNYPAYGVTMGKGEMTVSRFELIAVDEKSFIAVVMLSNNVVRSQVQQSPLPVQAQKLNDLKHLLNTHFVSQTAREMNGHLMNLSDQVTPDLFMVMSKTVEFAVDELERANARAVATAGAGQILKMPEYRDVDRAQELMTFFVDNKEKLPVSEDGQPLQILIGPENVSEALRDTSVVMASYDIGEGMRGVVGVVGPTRMDYAKVTARLSYFADSLTKMFGKRELPENGKEQKE